MFIHLSQEFLTFGTGTGSSKTVPKEHSEGNLKGYAKNPHQAAQTTLNTMAPGPNNGI